MDWTESVSMGTCIDMERHRVDTQRQGDRFTGYIDRLDRVDRQMR